ncbi:MAG: GHKL domain-containing protein [Myxococcales bacterium]|nr:GHKL domain-containing protein [Myxococcales bacterium]
MDVKKDKKITYVPETDLQEPVALLLKENSELKYSLKQKENELKESQAQLAQAGKLATLGTMGAGIAHELNNPLTVVSAEADEIIDALEGAYGDENLVMECAKNIKHCADRMRIIVDHIRQYTRNEADDGWQKLNINDPINDSLILLKSQLENSGVNIKLQLGDNLPKIWGHTNKLESVFQNLMSNAKDAFDKITDDRVKQLTIISCQEDRGQITVKFKDNACGMSDEVKRNLFNPFYTTKEIDKGTGLGLSITKTNVKEHRGEIIMKSAKGKGTEFTLTFPLERRTIVHK